MKQIYLTQNQITLVDDKDFEELNQYKWYFTAQGYAARDTRVNGKRVQILMHRLLLNPPKGLFTDHKDKDKLNNQRNNLRVATKAQNGWNVNPRKRNKSGHLGVYFFKRDKTWQAQLTYLGKRIHLGYFKEIEDAIKARKLASKRYYGVFSS